MAYLSLFDNNMADMSEGELALVEEMEQMEKKVVVSYPEITLLTTKVKTQPLMPNSNLTDTIDSHKDTEDTSTLFNHTNTTKESLQPVLMYTHSDSNQKNTNLQEHVICPELIMPHSI